jgi:hypothetical protein
VDREGVIAQPLRLVEKGVLKGYLLTRQPVHGYSGSNGRARLPGSFGAATPTLSNLFVSATETVPVADLKKKLIELCQTRSKPYGILIRKLDFPSSAARDEAIRIIQASGGSSRPVGPPILAYKVYPDGREELVRGLRFRGFNGGAFAMLNSGGYTTEVSVVAPSLLIDDLELHAVEEEMPKLPVVPPPDLIKQ